MSGRAMVSVSAPLLPLKRNTRLLLAASRPRQWTKNLLVLAAPAASGTLNHTNVLVHSVAAAAIFTLASVGGYLVNDAYDAHADRLHPVKRDRPVASGALSVRTAKILGYTLCTAALFTSALLGPRFGITILMYLALTAAYSLRLKKITVIDIITIAMFFLLRAVGGGTANGIPLSRWFLMVAAFGALFLVVGKRRAELATMGSDAPDHRDVSALYSPEWLAQVQGLALTATVVAYCLWAFQSVDHESVLHSLVALSTIPFTTALLRYSLLVSRGDGERPEQLLVHDRLLVGCAVSCGLMLVLGWYVAH
jgi:decaprenyl-phosphate phosphoribosyltransferase